MPAEGSDPARAVLITGAASGNGRAAACLFAARGWSVGALDRDEAGPDALRAALGGAAILVRPLDVTDRHATEAAVAAFGEKSHGRLDLLFSNAGIDAKGPFADMTWDRIAAVLGVNLLGPLALIRAAFPLLRATPGSLCLSTASASAIFGAPGMAVYSATKHAVRGLTEALSVEFAAHGVRAADLLPGIVDTGMLPPEYKAMLPTEGMWRPLPAEAVAETAWSAYHGDKLHWYVPEELAAYDLDVTRDPEAARDARIAGRLV